MLDYEGVFHVAKAVSECVWHNWSTFLAYDSQHVLFLRVGWLDVFCPVDALPNLARFNGKFVEKVKASRTG